MESKFFSKDMGGASINPVILMKEYAKMDTFWSGLPLESTRLEKWPKTRAILYLHSCTYKLNKTEHAVHFYAAGKG